MEITGQRPTNYSHWHRNALPAWCYMTDGDWFEQRQTNRGFVSVAYIETIEVPETKDAQKKYHVWKSKESLCNEIQAKMGIPVYIVWHDPECKDFLVLKLGQANAKEMNAKKYAEFVKGL